MADSKEELLVIQNFIDGKYVPPINGQYIDNFNPATGKVYGKIPDSDEKDIDAAVVAAKKAFRSWSRTTAEKRSQYLNKIADILESKLAEFAAAESKDQGKPLSLATAVDIPRSVWNFRFFAGAILHGEEMATATDGAISYTQRVPIGVAGLISPWNLPLYLLSWKIAPAIAVGNCCVCKPSEMTSVTAWMLGSVLNEAGLPPGVVNIVMGRGQTAGSALIKHPDVPLISFTGGTKTAETIIKESAPNYKKLSLELGGKNPNIIFEDADLNVAIPTSIRSSFANQGEICLCGSRIFVHRKIYDEFLKQFVEQTKKLIVGDPNSPQSNLGALISSDHRDKVKYYIDLAKEEGGTIAAGGNVPDLDANLKEGYYLNPTIITGVGNGARVMQEEIFGPVVTVAPFDTEDEVVDMANDVKYGLSASIWTENVKVAHRVAAELDVGTVWVNTWMKRDLRVPFGGRKHSGYGREGGKFSLDFYTEQKTICLGV